MNAALQVLKQSVWATLDQSLPVLAPLILLGWLIHLASGSLERGAVRLLGLRLYIYSLGWIGTLVHELGHAVFCPLFGHQITGIRLFTLSTKVQAAGYVEHRYNWRNPYQLAGNFFIGVGPILLGTAIIYLSLIYLAGMELVPKSHASTVPLSVAGWAASCWTRFRGLLGDLAICWQQRFHLTNWRFYLAGYLVLAVGSAMTLSTQDISSVARGLSVVLCAIWLVNLGFAVLGRACLSAAPVLPWALTACAVMLLVLAACGALGLVFALLNRLFGK